ncbi:MAG: hypothetical protein RL291_1095, partial [Pseudomonadota bacterium]
ARETEAKSLSDEPRLAGRRRRARDAAPVLTESEITIKPRDADNAAGEPEWATAARNAAARIATVETGKTEPAKPSPESDPRGLAKLDLGRSSALAGEAGPSPAPLPKTVADAPTVAAAKPDATRKIPKTVEELPPLPQRRSGVMPFLMGMLLPLIVGAAGYYAISQNLVSVGPPQAPPTASAPAQPAPVSTGSIPQQPQRLPAATPSNNTLPQAMGDVVRVGASSPRGRPADSVTLEQALSLADRNLHGVDQAVDREEARFWLRKALSLSLNTEQMTWAVTQLGALYAAPVTAGETPDYDKARTLWEISGAHGDPVAHCFIASLYEHGLGVAADKRSALRHFTEARRLGGCRGVDQAIARLSQ